MFPGPLLWRSGPEVCVLTAVCWQAEAAFTLMRVYSQRTWVNLLLWWTLWVSLWFQTLWLKIALPLLRQRASRVSRSAATLSQKKEKAVAKQAESCEECEEPPPAATCGSSPRFLPETPLNDIQPIRLSIRMSTSTTAKILRYKLKYCIQIPTKVKVSNRKKFNQENVLSF